jgi:hypothetical protein
MRAVVSAVVTGHPLPAIAAIAAKLDRADEHLGTLHDEFQRFARDEPLGVRFECDFQSGWHTAYIPKRQPMPPRLSVLAGESLYQARSALEHLVWAMVKANHKKPGRHNSFPIMKTPVEITGLSRRAAFIQTVNERGGIVDGKKRQPGKLRGVPSAAIGLIEAAQPYTTTEPANHFLTILDEMAKDDRHHAIHGMFVGADPEDIGPLFTTHRTAEITGFQTLLTNRSNLVKGRTNIARLRIAPLSRRPKVKVDGDLPTRVAFGVHGEAPLLLNDLRRMNSDIRDLLRGFVSYF